MNKKKLVSSPRAASSTKAQKSLKHLIDINKGPTDRSEEIAGLMHTIDLLTEEKQLLYEYKKVTLPKIQQLKQVLANTESDLQKKDLEIQKLKSFYESEIASMQDYVNLLKNSDLEEQFRSEKARSMTFYRALTRKQQECEQKHKEIEKVKELESQISIMEQRLKKVVKDGEVNMESESRCSSQNSEVLQEVMKKIKNEVKDRMKECIDQAIVNFSVFNTRIGQLEEKIGKLEEGLRGKNFEALKVALEEMKREKLELQRTIEKNYKENIKDITSYEEEIERQKRKVRTLLQEIQENKLLAEGKLKKILNENLGLKSKCEVMEEKNKELESFGEIVKKSEEREGILKQVNQENAKLMEIVKELQRNLRDNQQKVVANKEEIGKLRSELGLGEKIIMDLKASLANTEKLTRLSTETIKKEASDSGQEMTCDKTKAFSIEKILSLSILNENSNEKQENNEKKIEKLQNLLFQESQLRVKDSQFSESLLVTPKQEENNIIRQEIDRLREEKDYFRSQTQDFQQEIRALNALVKKLKSEIESLTEDKQEVETDRSRVFKELKIANEVIFHNNKILDLNESLENFESERENFVTEIQKIQRKLEEVNEELFLEKIQHEETVKNLIQADKRIENLLSNLKSAEVNLSQKETEIENFQEKMIVLNGKFEELKKNFQVKLEDREKMISEFSEKEKINLRNLNKIREYKEILQQNEEKIEKQQVYIKELQEVVEQYRSEIEKNSEKIRELEQSLLKISKNLNENLELRKKIVDLGSPLKEQFSIDKTIAEESSREFADFEKIQKNRSNLRVFIEQLIDLEGSNKDSALSDRQKLLDDLQNEVDCQEIDSIDEIKIKVSKLQRKIKELREKYKVVIRNNENFAEQNQNLREKIRNLAGNGSFNENFVFESLSLEEKQVSYIEQDSQEKMNTLESENARLRFELKQLKDTTLGYSTSEDNTLRKADDSLSDTWIEKERTPIKLPPTVRKLVNRDENILILDNGDSISSESGISSPDVDISSDLIFESNQ